MAFEPGDWVELVRDVPGGTAGQRGRVSTTGFLGGLDIELENGKTLRGVDAVAVVASGPSNQASGGMGCAVLAVIAGGAVAAAVTAWNHGGWSL